MPKITSVKIRKVIDSRGNPTVEVDLVADGKSFGRAAAPGGASKGIFEVKDYPAKGIDYGISQFREKVAQRLIGNDALDQRGFDSLLHAIDGTPDFSSLGGNIAIAASLAFAKASARLQGLELYQSLLNGTKPAVPYPVGNVIGGGRHAINGTTMQEFMAISYGKRYPDSSFSNVAVHKSVGAALKKRFSGYPIGLGDEKAWVASLSDLEALEILSGSIKEISAGNGIKIAPAIDLAASEFYKDGKYDYKHKKLSKEEQVEFVAGIADQFSVAMLEDPLEQNDFEGFAELTKRIGKKAMIVGDDLFVTNKERLEKGIKAGAANAILIKPNQIGTLTDMIDTVRLAEKNGYERVISHRSGETEDSTIAHLAVGLGIKYIKTGTIGGERTAKHNELIRIEEMLSG